MKLKTIQIDDTVRSGLNSFTDGVIIRDTKVLITLNLPDGQKTTIEGEWRHMLDANRLSERITMLQHAIYEQYQEYRAEMPVSWSR
ncbi:hypothetical protein [Klebsiella quasipneumoniae]|uniref:hypothetical protein n=1 Tax=Klebsiella quasipneumoniae TaxID=1463165 RepID=UPI00237C27AB|nr:hypothetical protein [Klebsiella quasipneumoniae]MDD9617258.1 hypothetical protein [Klebsiella quasipneumoniae]MDD9622456.1 hypothetical protein [Klebsiella quasipneumoniae]MDD9627526.1 hypothetical protein [Klebsiella quasipneumoniae]